MRRADVPLGGHRRPRRRAARDGRTGPGLVDARARAADGGLSDGDRAARLVPAARRRTGARPRVPLVRPGRRAATGRRLRARGDPGGRGVRAGERAGELPPRAFRERPTAGTAACRRVRGAAASGGVVTTIEEMIARVGPLDAAAMESARARHRQLTKPPGSLGRLEELAIKLAGIAGRPIPAVERKAVVVMAGDHGVALAGVSAYPQ